jgi:hypothetical protein
MPTIEKNLQPVLKENALVATSARNAEKINSLIITFQEIRSRISDQDFLTFLAKSMSNGAASSLNCSNPFSLYEDMEIILNILSEGVDTLHYHELVGDEGDSIHLIREEEVRYEVA